MNCSGNRRSMICPRWSVHVWWRGGRLILLSFFTWALHDLTETLILTNKDKRHPMMTIPMATMVRHVTKQFFDIRNTKLFVGMGRFRVIAVEFEPHQSLPNIVPRRISQCLWVINVEAHAAHFRMANAISDKNNVGRNEIVESRHP